MLQRLGKIKESYADILKLTAASEELLKQKKKARSQAVTGGILAGSGAFLFLFFPMLFSALLGQIMVLKEGGLIFELWKAPPLGVPMKIYLYEFNNPDDFIDGKKARLTQRGPYYYDYYRYREIIGFTGTNNERLQYYDFWAFNFNEEKSVGKLSEKITVLNAVYYMSFAIVKTVLNFVPLSFAISPVAMNLVYLFLSSFNEKMAKTLTVDELVNGYPFGIMEFLDSAVIKPLEFLGVPLPPEPRLPNNKFGLFGAKNHTNRGGPFEVYTGQGGTGPDKFLRYTGYRGKRILNAYDDVRCNMINGTEGGLHGPFTDTDNPIYFFIGEFCRTMIMFYDHFKLLNWVIPVAHYAFVDKFYGSPAVYPMNKCYCRTLKNYAKCHGIFHLGTCYWDVPASISKPHFLDASDYFINGVEGLSPNKELHESYMDIETVIGAPLQAAIRIQVNFDMFPISFAPDLGDIRETMMPFIWIEANGGLEDLPFWLTILASIAIFPLKLLAYGSPLFFLGGVGFMGRAYNTRNKYKKEEKELEKLSKAANEYSNFSRQKQNYRQFDSYVHPEKPEKSTTVKSISLPSEVARENAKINQTYVETYREPNKLQDMNNVILDPRLINSMIQNQIANPNYLVYSTEMDKKPPQIYQQSVQQAIQQAPTTNPYHITPNNQQMPSKHIQISDSPPKFRADSYNEPTMVHQTTSTHSTPASSPDKAVGRVA